MNGLTTTQRGHEASIQSTHYDHQVFLSTFSEGDIFLVFNSKNDSKPRLAKFVSKWIGPYVIKKFLPKGAYVLKYDEGIILNIHVNGLYLKWFYP